MIQDILSDLQQAESSEDIMETLAQYYRRLGFQAVSLAFPASPELYRLETFAVGFPMTWVDIYRRINLRQIDPVSRFAMESGEPVRWSEIGDHVTLDDQDRAFLKELKKSGLTDGYTLPTFGTYNRVGIVLIGEVVGEDVFADSDPAMLQAVAQQAHVHLTQIAIKATPPPQLSPREQEILRWISEGKSNADIATILGISTATVATYTKRLFQKMGVNDRTSAAVMGVQLGVLTA